MERSKAAISHRLELVSILVLLSLIVLVRAWNLDADPPIGLSISTDVYTDPPQYTLFAKQFVLTGEFNPFGDYRLAFFLKSTVTLLAVGVFKILGVGVYQSNLAGLLYSLGALFLFFLFVRRIGGQTAGILFLALIAFNYNQLFYGRLPFLEHAMAFWSFLALVLVVYCRRWWGFLAAGISLGAAVLFSKVIGVVFVFPFACYFAYRIRFEEERKRVLVSRLKHPVFFAAGFAVIAVFFLFFTYLPMREQVAGYLSEQSLSLYGAPEGLESFGDFIQKMVTLGDQTKLFPRMTTVALLATVLILQALYHVARKKSWREGFGSLGSGQVFMVAAIIAFYGSLMIWNYRPLRYQLIMIYPFYGAAAVVLTMLWGRWRKGREFKKTPWLFYLLGWPVMMTVIFQFSAGLADYWGKDFYFDDKKYLVGFSSLVLTVVIGLLISLYNKGTLPRLARAAKIFVVLALVGVMAWGFADYRFWWQRPTFMARDNSRDMQMILSPGAVLSGPFAPLLTLENRLGTVIHMFGVSQADPELFARFPVTHLLADKGNEDRAAEDYPGLMDSSVRICTYHVGLKKARLIRIGGHTGNRRADAYRRSIFERAMDYFSSDSAMLGNRLARQFMIANPENISGNLLMGEKAEMAEYIDEAEWLFKKAVEFSPTNYDLNARLAQFYRDQYDRSDDPRFRTKAVEYFEHAIMYAPNVASIQKAYSELKGK